MTITMENSGILFSQIVVVKLLLIKIHIYCCKLSVYKIITLNMFIILF